MYTQLYMYWNSVVLRIFQDWVAGLRQKNRTPILRTVPGTGHFPSLAARVDSYATHVCIVYTGCHIRQTDVRSRFYLRSRSFPKALDSL